MDNMIQREEYTIKKTGLFQNETLIFYTYTAHNGLIFKTTAASLDICRKLRDRWQRHLSTSFTGHRHVIDYNDTIEKVKQAVRYCYNNGVRFFYVGGAVGFDTVAAEAVISLKAELADIVLIIVVPFPGQNKYYNSENNNRYLNILKQVDEVVTISNDFSNIAYLKRNDYMISHSCQLIAYWDEKSLGGTSYTVRKAREKKLAIYNLYKK